MATRCAGEPGARHGLNVIMERKFASGADIGNAILSRAGRSLILISRGSGRWRDR